MPVTWVSSVEDDEGTPIGDGLEEVNAPLMVSAAAPVTKTAKKAKRPPCPHLGGPSGETTTCPSCTGRVKLKVFACKAHRTYTVGKKAEGVACCVGCPDRPVEG